MKIAVPRESVANERRIALLPDTIKRLVGRKLEVVVESGAGVASGASDADYRAAGAQISAGSPLADADVVVKIHAPSQQEVLQLKEGSTIISLLYPMTNPSLVEALRAQKVTALLLGNQIGLGQQKRIRHGGLLDRLLMLVQGVHAVGRGFGITDMHRVACWW